MRRRLSHCLLLALLAVLSAAPAAAGTIVGQFYFQRDVCDPDLDPFCSPFDEPFAYFNLINTVDEFGPLAGLTFSALIQIDGVDYDYQFIDPTPIAIGGSAITNALVPGPFGAGGTASLLFNGGNAADYFGTLRLSNHLSDDPLEPAFFANVEFIENGPVTVPEAPSWLVVVLGVGALAVGRVFLT